MAVGKTHRSAGVDAGAERSIIASATRGDTTSALGSLLDAYGDELRSFVRGLLRDEHAADEAWAMVQEDLWRGLRGFRAEASARTWAYVVAQRACYRFRTRAPNRHEAPLSAAQPNALAARTNTSHLRRERRHALVEELREGLSLEDRTLLLLRVDRGLSWEDVGRVLAEMRPDGERHEVSVVALRKRFERIKTRLRARLHEANDDE